MPWALRPRLAHDRALLSRALAAFIGAIFRWQRAAARALGVTRPQPGAVTAVQRFGSRAARRIRRLIDGDDHADPDDDHAAAPSLLEVCPRCAGHVRVLAAITPPATLPRPRSTRPSPPRRPPTAIKRPTSPRYLAKKR